MKDQKTDNELPKITRELPFFILKTFGVFFIVLTLIVMSYIFYAGTYYLLFPVSLFAIGLAFSFRNKIKPSLGFILLIGSVLAVLISVQFIHATENFVFDICRGISKYEHIKTIMKPEEVAAMMGSEKRFLSVEDAGQVVNTVGDKTYKSMLEFHRFKCVSQGYYSRTQLRRVFFDIACNYLMFPVQEEIKKK